MDTSRIFLAKRNSSRVDDFELIEGDLCDDITQEHLRSWEMHWRPEMVKLSRRRGCPAEDGLWDWRRLASWARLQNDVSLFAISLANRAQGFMICYQSKVIHLPGANILPVVYVDRLASAPWNRPPRIFPYYGGVGRVLIAAAIELSFRAGQSGRIGLHSLPEAERFYESSIQMNRIGPDPNYNRLIYFELSETRAQELRPH